MKKILFLFAILATVVFTSCTKEGKQGVAGKDGNANVICSNTVTLTNWVSDYDDGVNYTYSSAISYPAITEAVKNKGAVLMYAQMNSDWVAMPYSDAGTDVATGNSYSEAFNYTVSTGSVKFEVTGFDDTGSAGVSNYNGLTVRIVVIPASVTSKYPNTNWKDYKEVDRLINIYRIE